MMLPLKPEKLLALLGQMVLIRQFEMRAEAAYFQGKIGGFFHSYTGQEAIQTALLDVIGLNHWYIATYRVHALALLLGVTPKEIMAELFGRANGNAKGRGGSMHLYTERLLGGFAIVGGQIPIAMGAAFSIKYQKKEEIAVCFLGEGAVAQGAFHEALNLASLWSLPCLIIIENNRWGMGTPVEKAVCFKRIAEDVAPAYGISGYSIDGMDLLACHAAFEKIYQEILHTRRPILVECMTERFKGHSISDPGLYRTREKLEEIKKRDPILLLKAYLIENGILNEEKFALMNKENHQIVIDAIAYAENSPWPDPATLEEGVYAE